MKMSDQTDKIDELELRLDSILPDNWEDRFETHEDRMEFFERSFDQAEAIARQAIVLLKGIAS
jgi:hypothetical protein